MGDNSSSIAERRQPIFTMATSPNQYVKLAQQLPPRLSRFFARYPPQAIVSSSALSKASSPCTPAADSSASSADHISTGQDGLTVPSPFRCQKHPITGKWHDPVFSLRRQAELVKLARQHWTTREGQGVRTDIEGTVGEAQTGYVGDAADDPDVERERSWTWMEEVAEIDVLDLMMRGSIKFRDCTNIILFIRCIGNGVTEMYYIVVHHLSNSCYPTEILKKEPTWNDFAKFFLLLILIWD